MTSAKQIAANRENAKQSTGPKTKVGKSQSRQNALRHGLASVILEGSAEDQEVNRIARAILDPSMTDPAAIYYARQVAEAENTLRRVQKTKFELFNALGIDNDQRELGQQGCSPPHSLSIGELITQASKLDRYERRARSHRKKALRQLLEAQQ